MLKGQIGDGPYEVKDNQQRGDGFLICSSSLGVRGLRGSECGEWSSVQIAVVGDLGGALHSKKGKAVVTQVLGRAVTRDYAECGPDVHPPYSMWVYTT